MSATQPSTMDIEAIRRYMPHTYPMLLLDRVLDYKPGEYIEALKNITANEPYFPGHFPQRFIVPGVMTAESMFQAGALLGVLSLEASGQIVIKEGELPGHTLLTSVEKLRFRRPALPGDQLIIRVNIEQFRQRGEAIFGLMSVRATVEDDVCAEGHFRAVLAQK